MKQFAGRLFLSFLLGSLLFAAIRLSKQEDYLAIHTPAFILSEFLLAWLYSFMSVIFCDSWISRCSRRKSSLAIEFGAVTVYSIMAVLTVMTVSHFIEGETIELTEVYLPTTITLLYSYTYYLWRRTQQRDRRIIEQALKLEQTRTQRLSAELRLLRAQYHPHFLFNILNTIYFQIDEREEAPRRTIECLSELLRYQLYSPEQPVEIQRETEALEKFIELCRLRSSRRLQLDMRFDIRNNNLKIHPLLLIPPVENAFKFVGGDYRISITLETTVDSLTLKVVNSLPQVRKSNPPSSSGLGLTNLRRRLQLLYPDDRHSLTTHDNGSEFETIMKISTTN